MAETRPNDWDDVAARLLAHADAGTTDSAPCTYTVAVGDYADPGRWGREVDVLFRRSPVVVALSAHIPAAGNYRAVEMAGLPVVTVRQPDGGVKVFANVCRHRGAQVVNDGCGSARRFTCPYHGWSYDQSGALVGVSGRSTFGELDTASRGLTELACEERCGLVFAVLRPGAPLDLDAWLAGYEVALDALGLDDVEIICEREVIGPNWKVAYDGYVDGYHLEILHKNTIGQDLLGNVMTCDSWGPHQRVAFPRRNVTQLRDEPRSQWRAAVHIGLVHTVFPHVSVAGYADIGMMVSQLFPGPTADRSRTVQTHVLPVGASDDRRERTLRQADFLEQVVVEEDYRTGFGIQRGLASGANTEFVFGRNEPGNQRFHQWVDRLLETAGP
jgi:nitrite reductase/ring-hydroxylating ferredoxin subunit